MSDTKDLDNELDSLLKEFSNSNTSSHYDSALLPQPKIEDLTTGANLEKYTTDKMQEFLSDLINVSKVLLLNAKTTSDPELLNSLNGLLSNITKILHEFNSHVLLNKNNAAKKELQELKTAKKAEKILEDANAFISSRENAFKHILTDIKAKTDKDTIDID
jgi:hypothetical protein